MVKRKADGRDAASKKAMHLADDVNSTHLAEVQKAFNAIIAWLSQYHVSSRLLYL